MLHKPLQRLSRRWGIFQPLRQSARCLDLWMRESGRHLPRRERRRVAGLMARYFHYEEQVTDQLLLSFLRHYAGQREIDMEDPTSVRLEIKSILDRATARPEVMPTAVFVTVMAVIFSLMSYCVWDLSKLTLTAAQQDMLKAKVEKIVKLDHSLSRAAVWARVKKPLDASRYEDISYWDFRAADRMLEEWIRSLSGARM